MASLSSKPSESQSQKRTRTPRDVLRVVFRHRALFALGASAFAVAFLFAAPLVPQLEKKYTGTAKFERRSDAAAAEQRRGRGPESFEDIKLTLEHELKGRGAMEQAVEALGLTRGLPRGQDGRLTEKGLREKQKLIQRLMRDVKVRWEVRSDQVDLISVEFTDADPELARELPNTLVSNYITRTSEVIVQRLRDSRDFLLKQVEDIDARLQAAVKRRIEFEAEHGGMLPDNPGALQEKMRELSADIDTVRRQQMTARQKFERLKSLAERLQANPDEPIQVVKGPNPERQRLKEQLRELKEQLQDARTLRHMTEAHPVVITLKEKIAQVEKQLEETPEETVLERVFGKGEGKEDLTIALAAARSEVEMTEGELVRLQKRLDDLQSLLANYAPVREQYLRILKQIDELEAEKRGWQQRLTDVDMALSAEVAKRRTHLSAVQLAEKQFEPSFPKLSYLLGFALLGGLAFGSGLVLLSSKLDRSIWTPTDAEAEFGVPVCGVTGEILRPSVRAWRTVRRLVVEPLIALTLLAAVGLGCLNVTLWLKFPERYAQWTAAPLATLGQWAGEVWPMVRQAL